ncbi:YSIRK-type signal peptide-containing protein [Dolosigranulum pigrum]|uniref:YSIRK-type signal peptide-containing protein n=1 Tax=Dolosigranulum pigrum TaxID=29394 RepID=UPI000DC2BBA9|nr:YSIRK-type signal peptide-containing protein [Dolosigranulum pigrum]QJS97888.1 YSIRK-type signal peptide-containing protein [Dolosigranulum pigrum]
MISKNNKKLFMEKGANKYKRYTLKKLSVGVVSVSIGFGLMFGSVEGVSADELIGTNSVMEPNNIDSLQSNEEVSDESNIDKLSETVQSESSEQAVATDQSLETKRQEVKTILGQSNIVGEQYTDLVTKISNAQTIDELERILAEIEQTASLEDNQDESKQSETEHDAEEKLKNHSEEKDRELDKITPPSTETSLSKEASVENLVEVDQFNVTSDVKYTLNDVRHLLNSADIARVESGELTVQQIIEKLLNNKVELRETEARHENGVLAAGVEQNNISTDKQYGKSRSRRSLNGVDVESLFRPFTEQNTVRDVYDRIQQMRDAKLIAETELHFLQIEVLRHLRDGIADNKKDSNDLTPNHGTSKLPNNEKILNMHLSNQAKVTVPLSQYFGTPYPRIDDRVWGELDYVNELLDNIRSVLLARFGENEEGVYFSPDEYHNDNNILGSHRTKKIFHSPELVSNPNGTFTLKISSESAGGVELKNHYAFSFHISPELNKRVQDNQLVRGLYRPEKGEEYDASGNKIKIPVVNPIFETNHYSARNGVFPSNVGYYMSKWTNEDGYNRKDDKFAKIELTFEANDQKITDKDENAKLSSSILSNSFNYRHRSGTFIASQHFNNTAGKLITLLNLMTDYKQLENRVTATQQKIDNFNQSLGKSTRVITQQDYDNLNDKRQKLKQEIEKEIEQIKTGYTGLTGDVDFRELNDEVKKILILQKIVLNKDLKENLKLFILLMI